MEREKEAPAFDIARVEERFKNIKGLPGFEWVEV